jgi:hypothetical protein
MPGANLIASAIATIGELPLPASLIAEAAQCTRHEARVLLRYYEQQLRETPDLTDEMLASLLASALNRNDLDNKAGATARLKARALRDPQVAEALKADRKARNTASEKARSAKRARLRAEKRIENAVELATAQVEVNAVLGDLPSIFRPACSTDEAINTH